MPNFEQMRTYVKKLVEEHEIVTSRSTKSKLLRLEEDNHILIQAYKSTNEEIKSKVSIVPAAEWLLDNFYIIEEQFKDVIFNITKDFYRDLPVLSKGRHSGFPRVYAIAAEMVELLDAKIDDDAIIEFLEEYQNISPLSS